LKVRVEKLNPRVISRGLIFEPYGEDAVVIVVIAVGSGPRGITGVEKSEQPST
jgi:hypothetical protein